MKRETGYYWVKAYPNTGWETAKWTGNYWYLTGTGKQKLDASFFKINETRILNPDEK